MNPQATANETAAIDRLYNSGIAKVQDCKNRRAWENAILELPTPERHAIVLTHLHCQVCNGGFFQWIDNGYGIEAKAVVRALDAVGTGNALAVVGMLERLEAMFDEDGWIYEVDEYGNQSESDCEQYCAVTDELDKRFYKICDALRKEINTYLEKLAG